MGVGLSGPRARALTNGGEEEKKEEDEGESGGRVETGRDGDVVIAGREDAEIGGEVKPKSNADFKAMFLKK